MRIRSLAVLLCSAVFSLTMSAGQSHALICGDGLPDPGEQCDDLNLIDGDGCDSNCTFTGCGNNITTAGEACDDGNLISGDGCDANCTVTACGNTIVTGAEVCDDGNLTDGDGCDSNCTPTGCANGIPTAGEACDAGPAGSAVCDPDCTLPTCGDGITNGFANETCDDNNLTDGDGCDSNCTFTACGNNIPTAGEACDDGNLTSGDGCDANCTATACGNNITTAGEACDDGNLTDGDGCDANCTATACGNGIQTAGEACDDGNLASGDGCDSNCTVTACGNGIVTGSEQCDDGNLIDNDGCDANCTAPGCGNGVINPPETCDDNNTNSGDGCDANCTPTACGNGIPTGGEGCDDGNATSGDGCDANCTPTGCGNTIVTAGEDCDDGNLAAGDGCRGNCTVETCGDGIPDPQEGCDDGNGVDGDGCDTNCALTGCGNGVVTAGEQCDDGNLVDGDSCSSACQRELLNPVPAAGDRFGAAVAAAGPNVIVGVPLHDKTGAINTGLAYLYSGTTFQPIRVFENPTPNPGDLFGFSAAAVGPYVLIGAPMDSTVTTNAGAAYLFDAATGALVRTFLNPDMDGSRNFGWSVARYDNNHVIIGAPLDDVGTSGGGVAYLFNVNTGSLIQVYLNPTPSATDDFGFAVMALGTDVVIGSPGHDLPGAGFVFPAPNAGAIHRYDAMSGALLETIEDPVRISNGRFGEALEKLGTDIVVGAPAQNAGRVYRLDSATAAVLGIYFPPVLFGDDRFGSTLAITGVDKIAVGAPKANVPPVGSPGAVYVYDSETEALLQTMTKPTPVTGDEFGWSIAASGSYVVVGAPRDDTNQVDAGAVYFFPNTSCGNGGPLDAGEQCDDGNLVNGDGCDSNCTFTSCGNGVVTAPEQCDDDNNTAGDGCSPICGLEGACGDGVQSQFEQCDDGNTVSGDGCDANCTPTACGNGIVAGSEQCDNGANNGVDLCCSATCQRIDADADGVCDVQDVCPNSSDPSQSNVDGDIFGDACDICPGDVNNDSDNDLFCIGALYNEPAKGGDDPCSRTSGGTWTKPKVLFARVGAPAGDDTMRLKGFFSVGALQPVIQPHVYGVHIRVTDRNGRIMVDEHIPGGSPSPLRSWKVVGTPPTQWIYTDKTKPAVLNGISKVIIRNRAFVDPLAFSIAVQGNKGFYPILPNEAPVRVTVELNDTALPAGGAPGRDQCGEIQFIENPPSCKFVKSKLSCR